jgi:hypothetical protein
MSLSTKEVTMTVNRKCCDSKNDFQKKPRTRTRRERGQKASVFLRACQKQPALTKTKFREIVRETRERFGEPLSQRAALERTGICIASR